MAQDISPNGAGGVSSTNTMNPRNITPASAGSVSPTIISQNAQDRRRRAAAEREERRRQSLAANVERAEVEREYRQLRAEEEAANRRAEQRKAAAQREKVAIYSGGVGAPLEVRRVAVSDLVNLRGAAEPVKTPEELTQYQTIDRSGSGGSVQGAYRGLDKLRAGVNNLLRQEAEEKTAMQRARDFAMVSRSSYFESASAVASAPMTAAAREAHERAIADPNTAPEMRAQLTADLQRDSEMAAARGVELTAAEERRLSEEWYRGGTKEQKRIAQNYLGAAGSRYDVESSNRSVENRFINQLSKSQGELLIRYQASSEINNPDNTAATTAALRANQEGAEKVLDTLYRGGGDREKQSFESAQERRYAAQDKQLQEYLRTSPAAAEESGRYVESILRTDQSLDLSSDAFFREQGRTERRFGSDWGSAGGETAEDAAAAGKSSTAYSRFKGAPEDAEEFLLVDAAGKQRYTLKLGAGGAFAIYGWSGDLVGSGQSASGLAGALKNLNVPFDEKSFNPLRPDADSTLVELQEETDISGINTAAAFRAATLGTLRSNEEIIAADDSRRAAEKSAADAAALAELDERMTDELGHTIRIGGDAQDVSRLIQTPGMYVSPGAEEKGQIRSSDVTMVRDPAVDDALKSAGDLLQRVSPPAAIAGALLRTDSKRIDGAEDAGQQDFIVTQNEGALAELSDALISGSEMIGEANAGFNDWVKGLTGRKLIETEYGAQEKSWADIAGDLSGGPLQFGFKIAGENLAKGLGSDAEPDLMTETRRSVNKQILEMPLYAGSLIKIADSIASSGAEGGVPAAAAAAGFWGARAGEGIVSEAVSNPRKLMADLTAGLAVGTLTTAAVKPITTVATRAVKFAGVKTGEATGIVNTLYDPVEKSALKNTPNPLSLISREDMNVALFTKTEVSGIHYQKGRGFYVKEPKENRPYEFYGYEPKLLHYVTGNPFEGDIPGARDTLRGSQWVFTRRGWGEKRLIYAKMAHHYKNIPTIGNYLTETEKRWWISKFQGDAKFSPHTARRLYERAQGFADLSGKPVAIPSPKSLKGVLDAENEYVVVFPTNKIIINKNLITSDGERPHKFYLRDMPRRKFEGFDRSGSLIVSYDFAKKPAQKLTGLNPNPAFFIKNAAETYKDLRLSKDFKLYFDSRARYDAASGILKAERMSGVLPMSAMSAGAYLMHGQEHYQAVSKNLIDLKAGSMNPEVQKISDEVLDTTALLHDSVKFEDAETVRPHGERAGLLIKEGYYDDFLKRRGINDADKIKIGRAISLHTNLKPGIKNKIKYRPQPLDKLIATADRLDLVRFGIKPNPKKLFLRDILDEPWSWSSGQLLPPAPKRGSFEMPEVRSPELKGEITEPKIRDSGYYLSSQSQMSGALGGALGINAARGRQRESFTKENKKDTSERLKDKYTKKDEKYFEDYYKDKSSSRSGYYGRERNYGYRERYRGDYGYGRIKEYPRGYDFFKGYSSTYKIEPKNYAGESKKIDYLLQPSSYVMGSKYKGSLYKNTKYNLGAYQSKATIQPLPKTNPLRIKTKDKPKESKKERYRKITLENVEIPIVRAEDVLFSKDIGVLELPANKKTLYEFGNVLSTKKPSVKKRKRRSQ